MYNGHRQESHFSRMRWPPPLGCAAPPLAGGLLILPLDTARYCVLMLLILPGVPTGRKVAWRKVGGMEGCLDEVRRRSVERREIFAGCVLWRRGLGEVRSGGTSHLLP